MGYSEVTLRLPDWVDQVASDPARSYPAVGDRMQHEIGHTPQSRAGRQNHSGAA